MLVLKRKVGESIVIPESSVTVTIVAIQGGAVRLGITAPPQVEVHRQEVWQRIEDLAESRELVPPKG
jgi:carbon storage regulator